MNFLKKKFNKDGKHHTLISYIRLSMTIWEGDLKETKFKKTTWNNLDGKIWIHIFLFLWKECSPVHIKPFGMLQMNHFTRRHVSSDASFLKRCKFIEFFSPLLYVIIKCIWERRMWLVTNDWCVRVEWSKQ